MGKLSEQKHNEQEAQRRLDAILQGAFSGPPMPLKDIPKRNGESRAPKKPQRRLRRQRKNRAA